MINVEAEIQKLLREIGPGRMSSTAYDTAWVARLGEIDQDLSNQAMEWLCENQLPDGSWGAKDIFYYHDRVICTLAAMIALAHRGRRSYDKVQIEKGMLALEKITSGATSGLASDPNGATVGFEMIAPTLVEEAEKLGLIKQQGDRILGRMGKMRALKISKLAGRKINKEITPAFSAEMAEESGPNILMIDDLQESNGSVANSPSATAYLVVYLRPNDKNALNYLRKVINEDNGAPDFSPIDIFELGWVLWNLKLIPNLDIAREDYLTTHLNFLHRNWNDDVGIGTASNGTIKDGDDSGLIYDVLARHGIIKDIKAILYYEDTDHFRCFNLESNPSISTNIHVLGALRQFGFGAKSPHIKKISDFLSGVMNPDGFWFDKWHASPYYATSHAIINYAGYDNSQVEKSVEWILSTQNSDGSWGYYGIPTSEETSYCIQALSVWDINIGFKRARESVKRAYNWLSQNAEQNMDIPLWIGKALYSPERVVQSVIISAKSLAENIL